MFVMGFATMAVGLLPTYQQVGILAPALLVILRLIQGFAVAGEISGASSMILEHAPFGRRGYFSSFSLPGRAGRAAFGRRRVSADCAFHAHGSVQLLWLADSVPPECPCHRCRLHHSPRGRGNSCLRRRRQARRDPEVADHRGLPAQLAGHASGRLHGSDECDRGGCHDISAGPTRSSRPTGSISRKTSILWIPIAGNVLAVFIIPFVGDLSDKVGRRPLIIVGALGSGLLSFAYLYAISIHNMWMAIGTSLLMWGVVYQGYNAVFPSMYPELFQTKSRVSAMAIGQNLGTTITAMLPAIFAAVAPPGSTNIPLTIGAITFGVTVIAAVAAITARETYRIHLNDLGHKDAVPVEKLEYDRMRAQSLTGAKIG